MSLVVFADGVVAVEGSVKPGAAQDLYRQHPVDRDLADDSTVEEALRLKKRLGCELVVVSCAPADFEKHMRAYLAAGCDRALRIDADPAQMLDPLLRARVLVQVLACLPGWRAALFLDRTGAGAPALMPHYLARLLQVPSLAQVVAAQPTDDGALAVTRRADGMIRTYHASSPVVLAVSSRAALRNASFMDVHRSRKAKIEVVPATSLTGFAGHAAHPSVTRALRVSAPPDVKQVASALQLGVEETVERIAALCAPYLAKA